MAKVAGEVIRPSLRIARSRALNTNQLDNSNKLFVYELLGNSLNCEIVKNESTLTFSFFYLQWNKAEVDVIEVTAETKDSRHEYG